MGTREADAAGFLTNADTHDNLLFFTNHGRVFRLKCFEIPESTSRLSKGMAVINLFPLPRPKGLPISSPSPRLRLNPAF